MDLCPFTGSQLCVTGYVDDLACAVVGARVREDQHGIPTAEVAPAVVPPDEIKELMTAVEPTVCGLAAPEDGDPMA